MAVCHASIQSVHINKDKHSVPFLLTFQAHELRSFQQLLTLLQPATSAIVWALKKRLDGPTAMGMPADRTGSADIAESF